MSLRRNVIANFVAKGWGAALGLVFPPILVRLLGIESYGLIGIFGSLTAMLVVLDLGLSTTLQREVAVLDDGSPEAQQKRRDLVRTFEVVFWSLGGAAGVGVVVAAPWIVRHWIHLEGLAPDDAVLAIRAMGPSLALQLAGVTYNGGLFALQRQISANAIALVANTLRSGGGALVVWLLWRSPGGFFVAQACVMALQTLVTALWLRRSLGRGPRPAAFRPALLRGSWRFSAGTWGISLLGVALAQLDKIVVSKLLPLEALGYYTLAGTAATSLYYLIAPVMTAVFPRLCQLAGSGPEAGPEISRVYHLGVQILSIAVGSAAVVLCVFPREALFAWTGSLETVRNASGVLVLLVAGTALNGLMHLPYALQLAYGWTRLTFVTNCVGVALMVPATYLLGARFGVIGVASAWVMMNAAYVAVVVPLLHRRLLKGEAPRWYLQGVAIPVASAAAAALALRYMVGGAALGRASSGVVLVVAAAATLLASGLATRDVRALALRALRARVPAA